MTETQKLDEFKRPFHLRGDVIYDANGKPVLAGVRGDYHYREEMGAELIKVIDFYYAKKGEKE